MGPNTRLLHTGLRRVLSSPVVTALATPHGVDRYLELFDPIWSVNELRAEVIAVRHQTADTVTLTLRPNGNWRGFQAGQFVRLTVEIDGVRRTRCYSPANSVHAANGRVELTIKAHPTGYVSKFLCDKAHAGMIVTLSQASGSFALPAQRPQRILLISGGSGMTPVMSMLRTLCDEGHTGRITFLHYCNAAKDLIYAEELEAIAARYPNVELLRAFVEPEQCGELLGLFRREQLSSAVPDYAAAATFLCGPPGMMEAVQKLWAEDGISEQLHLERFTAAPLAIDPSRVEGELRFARSERLTGNTGSTLLEQAEAAGLRPEAGCRMGICHTCTCRKISGTVQNLQTGAFSSEADEDIQICISVPIGTVTMDL
jgi:ferredoxin-NADP reductase